MRFSVEEQMLSVRGDDDEESFVAEVLDRSVPRSLASGTSPDREIDAVAPDELAIDFVGFLAQGDATGHVEPISLRDVRHSKLLDKPRQRGCFAVVRHRPTPSSCRLLWRVWRSMPPGLGNGEEGGAV
jgi:hypothetical protein